MKNTSDFLDDLRIRHALTSDNKLAIHMGWQRAQVTRYRQRRETFSDETALKIAAQLDVAPDYIMACMAAQRAKSPETRTVWQRIAAKVAAAVLVGIGLQAAPSPAPAAFDETQFPAPIGERNTHMRPNRRNSGRKRGALRLSGWIRVLGYCLALAGCAGPTRPTQASLPGWSRIACGDLKQITTPYRWTMTRTSAGLTCYVYQVGAKVEF